MVDIGPLLSERQGRGPGLVPLTTIQIAKMFVSLVDDLFEREELQEAFGKSCVDDWGMHGSLGPQPQHELLIRTGREDLYPVRDNFEHWDQDTLFDAVELYGQLVSSGDPDHPDSMEHTFNGCGWHYAAFNPEPARSEYRQRVNRLLVRYDTGFVMNSEGQIERKVPALVDELGRAPGDVQKTDDEAIIQGAIRLFRSREINQRRASVRELADVLEPLRSDVKELMTKVDEKVLFEIANRFWIRHNDVAQMKDYDHDSWWDWMFQMNLASIRLLQRLKGNSVEDGKSVAELVDDLSVKVWSKGELAKRLDAIALSTLPEAAQRRIGVAVGRRAVGRTVVVSLDGVEACASSTDVTTWPDSYRVGLLDGLYLDGSGRIETIPRVQEFAVQLLLPVDPDGSRPSEFADSTSDRAFAVNFAALPVRLAASRALREASAFLPNGGARAAWDRLAERFADTPSDEEPPNPDR